MIETQRVEIRAGERNCSAAFSIGHTLREILESTECRPFSACAGNGSCGMCRVRVIDGETSTPSEAELLTLSESLLARGTRLACQTRLLGDARVEVLNPHPSTEWRSPGPGSIFSVEGAAADGTKTGWGLAVDLGTTNLSLSLVDLATGRRRAARTGLNRQNVLGSDIMIRLQEAAKGAAKGRQATALARETIAEAWHDLCVGEGFNPHRARAVSLVGNPAMMFLLLGGSAAALLDPAAWGRTNALPPTPVAELAAQWNLAADVEWIVPPLLYGFVGSDALAGIVACRLVEGEETAAFVDFGTNSEIALWHDGMLWLTSAAGGPAFEGAGIWCGASARHGAIIRLTTDSEGTLHREVLGDANPAGLSGSALVDLLSLWLDRGVLDSWGRFEQADRRASRQIFPDLPGFELSPYDVDMLQRAKAAVAAGLRTLLDAAGISAAAIARLFVAGTFGRFLRIQSALRIGLLPHLPQDRFLLCGNSALAGAELLLCSSDWRGICRRHAAAVRGINLAWAPDFDKSFLETLFLEPWEVEVSG